MFDVTQMPSVRESDGKPRYLFKGQYQNYLESHIDFLNGILLQNAPLLQGVDNPFIPPLNFAPTKDHKRPCNYTYLKENEKTPTGKDPKYRYVVYFNTFIGNYLKDWGNDTFGEIYYLQNGEIGKVRIIIWRKRKLHVVHMKLINGKLNICKVEHR